MMLIINLILFALLCIVGKRCAAYRFATPCFVLLFIMGLGNVAYFAHALDGFAAYYEYRSWRWVDFTPPITALLVGSHLWHTKNSNRVTRIMLPVVALMSVILPEAKSTFFPADYTGMKDRMDARGCVRQTTESSCGAASLATLLRRFGIAVTEREIAEYCGTSQSGTEVWKMARFARSRGLDCRFEISNRLPSTTAIIGIRTHGTGHFVALIENKVTKMLIADPGYGATEIPTQEIDHTGFSLIIRPAANAGQ